MSPELPNSLLDEYTKTGLLKKFVRDHGFLFVDRHMWNRLPKYKQLLLIGEAQSQSEALDIDVQVTVIDNDTGRRLAG